MIRIGPAAAIVVLFLSATGPEAPAAAQQERPEREALGGAVFMVEPPDARIEVGNRVLRAANAPPGRIGLPAGDYVAEITRPGYLPALVGFTVAAGRDVEVAVAMERTGAVLMLDGLPEDAKVYGNGRELRPDRTKIKPEVNVLPGRLDLVVTRGRQHHFETSLVVDDRSWLEVAVEMKPALVFLGTFGQDAAGPRVVAAAIDFLKEDGAHVVLDRSEQGRAVFAERGIDASVLRDWTAAKSELAWDEIQAQFQEETPAALYFAAVLSDDLAADSVDLWWWSAAPGPARPDRLPFELRSGRFEGSALRRLARSLNPTLDVGTQTPDLGVGLIESLKGDALIVATVEPGGPAAAAGLQPGMEVEAIDGEPASAEQLANALNRLQPGGTVEFAVRGDGEEVSAMVIQAAWGWTQLDVVAPDLSQAAAARLVRELDRTTDTPRWLIELDLAALALAAGDPESAIRLLEAIEAPKRAGLGAETVQYTLGVALSDLAERGQDEARQRALGIFEALAATEHEVAPRARLRADGQ
ncbi:MAG: PDZ domain-containing protein [Acidobacteriota bacterium]|nr:PDZ domain-containing protein [Acidobacteriota bacterium]MDE3265775.1 PDZ domain-containing protein [Acidobacteriota bacterium]